MDWVLCTEGMLRNGSIRGPHVHMNDFGGGGGFAHPTTDPTVILTQEYVACSRVRGPGSLAW